MLLQPSENKSPWIPCKILFLRRILSSKFWFQILPLSRFCQECSSSFKEIRLIGLTFTRFSTKCNRLFFLRFRGFSTGCVLPTRVPYPYSAMKRHRCATLRDNTIGPGGVSVIRETLNRLTSSPSSLPGTAMSNQLSNRFIRDPFRAHCRLAVC